MATKPTPQAPATVQAPTTQAVPATTQAVPAQWHGVAWASLPRSVQAIALRKTPAAPVPGTVTLTGKPYRVRQQATNASWWAALQGCIAANGGSATPAQVAAAGVPPSFVAYLANKAGVVAIAK